MKFFNLLSGNLITNCKYQTNALSKSILQNSMTLLSTILSLVYPEQCIACGSVPYSNDIPLCHQCLFSISPLCREFTGFSNLPKHGIPPMGKAIVLGIHEGSLQKAIHRLKQGHHFNGGRFLASTLANIIPESFLQADLITYVPSSKSSLRERGFNPAKILAEEVSRMTKIPLATNLLFKKKHTRKQALLSQSERIRNVEAAYFVSQKLDNTKVVLVDDVLTTGSTAVACANAIIGARGKIIGSAFYSYRPLFCT